MFTVTVIIPCYNMEAYIERAIKSVLDQTFRNWQLIVVDDGSTDNSWSIINKTLGHSSRVLGIRTDNHGVAAARNLAIERAEGEWILPLDADYWLRPDALYQFAVTIWSNKNADLIVPWVHHTSPDKDWVNKRTYKGYESLKVQNCLPNSGCYRRTGWFLAGGYRDGTMYEDWEFWLRLLKPDSKVVSLPVPVIEYTVRPGSRVKVAEKRHREEVEIIKKLNPEIYGNA